MLLLTVIMIILISFNCLLLSLSFTSFLFLFYTVLSPFFLFHIFLLLCHINLLVSSIFFSRVTLKVSHPCPISASFFSSSLHTKEVISFTPKTRRLLFFLLFFTVVVCVMYFVLLVLSRFSFFCKC